MQRKATQRHTKKCQALQIKGEDEDYPEEPEDNPGDSGSGAPEDEGENEDEDNPDNDDEDNPGD